MSLQTSIAQMYHIKNLIRALELPVAHVAKITSTGRAMHRQSVAAKVLAKLSSVKAKTANHCHLNFWILLTNLQKNSKNANLTAHKVHGKKTAMATVPLKYFPVSEMKLTGGGYIIPTRTYSSWYMYGEVTCMIMAVARAKENARITKRSSHDNLAKVRHLMKTRPRRDMKDIPRSVQTTPYASVSIGSTAFGIYHRTRKIGSLMLRLLAIDPGDGF